MRPAAEDLHEPSTDLAPGTPVDADRSRRAPPDRRGARPAPPGFEATGRAAWLTPELVTSAASGALLTTGWLLVWLGFDPRVGTAFAVLAIASGGYFFGRRALAELVGERRVGTYFLMSVGGLAALLIGHADEGALLVFLTSISEAAQGFTERKTRGSITALMKLSPRTALVRRDGREETVPVEELAVGDLFIARPGEAIATDGLVVAGRSEVDQAPVTGESVPVGKGPGDAVFAGTINGVAALEVRATRTAADNTLARIIRMVEEAREHKGRSQRFIERFGAVYSPLVLLLAAAVACLPPLALGLPWSTWLGRATVLVVAAAPCAMVISIPVALIAALGTAARQGVLLKGGIHLEELSRVRAVALDKTGTLTTGRPTVTDVIPLDAGGSGRPAEEILAVAAAIEAHSEHPLAAAIVQEALARRTPSRVVRGFSARPGRGAEAELDGVAVFAGSPSLFAELGRAPDPGAVEGLQAEGKTVVAVGDASGPWGLIALRDGLRPGAARAVAAMRTLGIERVVMLTGDNARTAGAIAREAGVDEAFAELRPGEKVDRIVELRRRFGDVAMVGDGVNDAPALAAATVGVAMGAAGTDVALETADVALMADDLEKLVYALRLARRNRSIVRQNLAMATAVIAALVLGAIAGLLPLPAAVMGHEISEFLVIGNGLRMLRS